MKIKCAKKLDNGARCPNDAKGDSNYCNVHAPNKTPAKYAKKKAAKKK
jgi:hypothetical protein